MKTRNTSRLHYFPQSNPARPEKMCSTQSRITSPWNQSRGKDSHFSDFYNALPVLRDTSITTATREKDNSHKKKLIQYAIFPIFISKPIFYRQNYKKANEELKNFHEVVLVKQNIKFNFHLTIERTQNCEITEEVQCF